MTEILNRYKPDFNRREYYFGGLHGDINPVFYSRRVSFLWQQKLSLVNFLICWVFILIAVIIIIAASSPP